MDAVLRNFTSTLPVALFHKYLNGDFFDSAVTPCLIPLYIHPVGFPLIHAEGNKGALPLSFHAHRL